MAVQTAELLDRLRALRDGLTYREIADRVGVTPQAVQKWERGGRISRTNAEAYDEALGAGGEVLDLLGFSRSGGPTIADLDRKLDALMVAVRDLGASVAELRHAAPGAPAPRKRSTGSRH